MSADASCHWRSLRLARARARLLRRLHRRCAVVLGVRDRPRVGRPDRYLAHRDPRGCRWAGQRHHQGDQAADGGRDCRGTGRRCQPTRAATGAVFGWRVRERGSYVGCIAGALSYAEFVTGLESVGLTDISLTATHAVADGLDSAIIKATKPLTAGATAAAPVVDVSRRELPLAKSSVGACASAAPTSAASPVRCRTRSS